jgi:hypothetical protein
MKLRAATQEHRPQCGSIETGYLLAFTHKN